MAKQIDDDDHDSGAALYAANGNGHGGPTPGTSGMQAKLIKLLAFHEAAAAAVRTTLGLLNGAATATKRQAAPTVMAAALALDSQRRATTETKRERGHRKWTRVQRLAAAARMRRMNRDRWARRTTKAAPRTTSTPSAAARRAQRARSAAVFLKIARKRRPTRAESQYIGALVRRGYLTKTPDGYLRTEKAYIVDTRKGGADA